MACAGRWRGLEVRLSRWSCDAFRCFLKTLLPAPLLHVLLDIVNSVLFCFRIKQRIERLSIGVIFDFTTFLSSSLPPQSRMLSELLVHLLTSNTSSFHLLVFLARTFSLSVSLISSSTVISLFSPHLASFSSTPAPLTTSFCLHGLILFRLLLIVFHLSLLPFYLSCFYEDHLEEILPAEMLLQFYWLCF